MGTLNTEKISRSLRDKAIKIESKSILITNFNGSEQEKDLSVPSNCNGFGRIHHFKLDVGKDWPTNPLPILPAAKVLGFKPEAVIKAQVFQSSVCNWRCWYCFVDYKLLSGNIKNASYLTCDDLLDLYLSEPNPAPMIDLSGGQPDLTPEWVPWMMQALINRNLQDKIYLWSDDNLSNDYLWRYLSDKQKSLMASYKMYSRVCCFKGIDEKSFELNTKAEPSLFHNQFNLCKKLINLGLDLYCYITLTASTKTNFNKVIPEFLDGIQNISHNLPLRIVPLKIMEFTPVVPRMNETFRDMIEGQYLAIEVWQRELEKRFAREELILPITEVKIR